VKLQCVVNEVQMSLLPCQNGENGDQGLGMGTEKDLIYKTKKCVVDGCFP
jgi:hypothetical protein